MTSSYAGKVYRMDRASVSGALGTPLCDQLIEVDKIELHLYGEDKSTNRYTFSYPKHGCFGATIAFDGFTSFQIGNVRETETPDGLTYDLLHFFDEKGVDTVELYPGGIEVFNSAVSISKALFDRLVAAGLFVEENAQKADDHAGMIFNPFTNSWSFGFCG